MDNLDFIIGLMKDNYNALGFIPYTSIRDRYLKNNQYFIQSNGIKPVGYLLHGVPKQDRILTITQSVIDYDYRSIGYGHDMLNKLINRAIEVNCLSLRARVADDLDANKFWVACGFVKTDDMYNPNGRKINIYELLLNK